MTEKSVTTPMSSLVLAIEDSPALRSGERDVTSLAPYVSLPVMGFGLGR